MQQVTAVILRELIILKRKFWRYFFSFSIAPLLYFITFGWGGRQTFSSSGGDYGAFLLPGLIAMSAMTNSISLSTEINVARFYWKTFDEIRTAPVADWAYVSRDYHGMIRGAWQRSWSRPWDDFPRACASVGLACSQRAHDHRSLFRPGHQHGLARPLPRRPGDVEQLRHHAHGFPLRDLFPR
jgi:hypothetical protein